MVRDAVFFSLILLALTEALKVVLAYVRVVSAFIAGTLGVTPSA